MTEALPEAGGVIAVVAAVAIVLIKGFFADKSDRRSSEAKLIDNLQETVQRQDAQLALKDRRIDELTEINGTLAHASDMAVHRWRNAEQALTSLIDVVRTECLDTGDGELGRILDHAMAEAARRIAEHKRVDARRRDPDA